MFFPNISLILGSLNKKKELATFPISNLLNSNMYFKSCSLYDLIKDIKAILLFS